jgi:anti-sigma B factor antagonist
VTDFEVSSEVREGALDVVVAGELDMAAAFKLESRLDPLLDTGELQSVALDLGGVDFVDSAGLGALLSLRERAHQVGIPLAITRASDPVQRLLELTGSDSAFEG